jgi:hypothetical protein
MSESSNERSRRDLGKVVRVSPVVALVLVLSAICCLPGRLTTDPSKDGGDDVQSAPDGETCPSTYRTAVMADHPLLYFRFGEATGPTAIDEMGNYPGDYPGAGITYGQRGAINGDTDTAIGLDGTTHIIMQHALNFAGTAPYSVEVWINLSGSHSAQWSWLVDDEVYDSPSRRNGWNLHVDWGDGRTPPNLAAERNLDGIGTNTVETTGGAMSTGAYHHVVLTFDGQLQQLFIDARERALSPSSPPSLKPIAIPWTIGATSPGGDNLAGALDELAVYDHALSGDRIACHWQASGR